MGNTTRFTKNGFAMAKGNEKMHKIINTGLKTIKENGEYDKIYEKWFCHG